MLGALKQICRHVLAHYLTRTRLRAENSPKPPRQCTSCRRCRITWREPLYNPRWSKKSYRSPGPWYPPKHQNRRFFGWSAQKASANSSICSDDAAARLGRGWRGSASRVRSVSVGTAGPGTKWHPCGTGPNPENQSAGSSSQRPELRARASPHTTLKRTMRLLCRMSLKVLLSEHQDGNKQTFSWRWTETADGEPVSPSSEDLRSSSFAPQPRRWLLSLGFGQRGPCVTQVGIHPLRRRLDTIPLFS